MKRAGLLGGTFDPIHLGHIDIAGDAATELELDKVILMPTFVQPFKAGRYTAPPEDRLEMCRLASVCSDMFIVSDMEIRAGGLSYTYDTLCKLRLDMRDTHITFIMGSDSLMNIDTWNKGPELLGICSFAVGLRPDVNRAAVEEKAEMLRTTYDADIHIITRSMLPVSSTEIRRRVENGEPISGLVTPEVEEYIYERGLYK